MDRSEKEETLNCYCNSIDDCDNCELMKKYDRDTSEFTDQYSCIFHKMSDDMLNKCYNWYKELDQTSCENAETKCCNKERVNPDREFFRIEPKEAIDVLKEIFNVDVHFVDEDCDENEEDE